MKEYHQPYSEIDKMSIKDFTFFLSLYESKTKYEQIEREKQQAKLEATRKKMKRR